MTLDSSTHGEDGVQGSYELPLGMLSLFRVLLPCAILHQESFKYWHHMTLNNLGVFMLLFFLSNLRYGVFYYCEY